MKSAPRLGAPNANWREGTSVSAVTRTEAVTGPHKTRREETSGLAHWNYSGDQDPGNK